MKNIVGSLSMIMLFPILLGLCSSAAEAHSRSVSYSSLRMKPSDEGEGVELDVSIRLRPIDVSALSAGLGGGVTDRPWGILGIDDPSCVADPASVHSRTDGRWLSLSWKLHCVPPVRALRITGRPLFQVMPSHVHFAVVRSTGHSRERILDSRAPTALVEIGVAAPDDGTAIGRYLVIGLGHILSGWDHLLFLFALVLIGGTLKRTALVVTGFTIGHALTLTAAVLGAVRADTGFVEALIALSIVIIAAENLWLSGRRDWIIPAGLAGICVVAAVWISDWPARVGLIGVALFVGCHFVLLGRAHQPERLRLGVAALFGLVHGFGFAGALAEMGLEPGNLGSSLLGFNIGVEIGQLVLLVPLWFVVRRISRRPRAHLAVLRLCSTAAIAVAMFWFVARSFGAFLART